MGWVILQAALVILTTGTMVFIAIDITRRTLALETRAAEIARQDLRSQGGATRLPPLVVPRDVKPENDVHTRATVTTYPRGRADAAEPADSVRPTHAEELLAQPEGQCP
jgi:hypothetical protein